LEFNMPHRKPNILLITTDQQRYDALGINGNPVLRTPNLDALATGGTNFSRCYVSCPVCIPARRTLISGLHPDTHGMQGYRDGCEFDPKHTLPGCLSAAGYQTQLVGKLHLHPQRKRYGFDHMILSDSANHRPTSPNQMHNDYTTWLIDQGHSHHSNAHGISGNGRVGRPWTLSEELHHSSWVAEMGARFLETTRDPSCPWFVHLSFVAPHPPLIPPQAYWDRYANNNDLRPTIADWAPRHAPRRGKSPDAATGPFDAAEIRDAIAGYYGLINHIDDRINYVLERFFEYGNPRSKEPLYILFSSDHGEMLGDHHLFRKSLPYEASAHVPFFISGRNVDLPRERTSDALVGWEDIMPTILDLAGVDIPDGLDGKSLVSIARGDATDVREAFHGVGLDRVHYRYVVAGRFKYVWFIKTNEEQLFDVIEDPNDCHDLSGNASLLGPMRDLMAPVAARSNMPYDLTALKPCADATPKALGYAGK
jgi:arylsulfatase A-like enzyme